MFCRSKQQLWSAEFGEMERLVHVHGAQTAGAESLSTRAARTLSLNHLNIRVATTALGLGLPLGMHRGRVVVIRV